MYPFKPSYLLADLGSRFADAAGLTEEQEEIEPSALTEQEELEKSQKESEEFLQQLGSALLELIKFGEFLLLVLCCSPNEA